MIQPSAYIELLCTDVLRDSSAVTNMRSKTDLAFLLALDTYVGPGLAGFEYSRPMDAAISISRMGVVL